MSVTLEAVRITLTSIYMAWTTCNDTSDLKHIQCNTSKGSHMPRMAQHVQIDTTRPAQTASHVDRSISLTAVCHLAINIIDHKHRALASCLHIGLSLNTPSDQLFITSVSVASDKSQCPPWA